MFLILMFSHLHVCVRTVFTFLSSHVLCPCRWRFASDVGHRNAQYTCFSELCKLKILSSLRPPQLSCQYPVAQYQTQRLCSCLLIYLLTENAFLSSMLFLLSRILLVELWLTVHLFHNNCVFLREFWTCGEC